MNVSTPVNDAFQESVGFIKSFVTPETPPPLMEKAIKFAADLVERAKGHANCFIRLGERPLSKRAINRLTRAESCLRSGNFVTSADRFLQLQGCFSYMDKALGLLAVLERRLPVSQHTVYF